MTTTVALTTDVVLLAADLGAAHVLLIQRRWEPYAGRWALPGGYVEDTETCEQGARRELGEETGITAPRLYPAGVYDTPTRDPRGRVVSVAFCGLLPALTPPVAGDDAVAARWVPTAAVRDGREQVAFDHADIIAAALTVLTPHGRWSVA